MALRQPPPGRIFRFGVFEADVDQAELRKRGLRVRLQTQPFRVLALLLENAGRIVSRDELQAELWPDDTFVDFDHGLNSAVNKIRQALGDAAANPRFVETVPRQGYRFVAPAETTLHEIEPEREPPPERRPAEPPTTVIGAAPPGPTLRFSRRLVIGAGLGLATLAGLGAYSFWDVGSRPAPPESRRWGFHILAGRNTSKTTASGVTWESDRYARGGETTGRGGVVLGAEEPFLFQGERYGSFEYAIPVPPGKYRVRLHFAETWFGAGNPGPADGRRLFDVAVNGEVRLDDVDPARDAGGPGRALVRELEGIKPNAEGRIVLTFVPEVENPLVNAIEVEPM